MFAKKTVDANMAMCTLKGTFQRWARTRGPQMGSIWTPNGSQGPKIFQRAGTKDMANLDLGWGSTWTRDMANLGQGHGQPGPGKWPTWTRHMAQPEPGTWLNLDLGWGSTWTRHGAQPGPGTGLTLSLIHI